MGHRGTPSIERIVARAYTVPTDRPESDGTLQWDATTLVVVHVRAADTCGVGYTYAHAAASQLINTTLWDSIAGSDAMAVTANHDAMIHAVRNLGRSGMASTAIAAIDIALWDLKARLLDLPLVTLLGAVRHTIPVYGSGGFTSYSEDELREQMQRWTASGIRAVKMKIGREPKADLHRIHVVREAIGPDVELFVDANGAYSRKQALRQAERFAADDVSWFEEPVSSDDLDGLRLVTGRAPAGMDIAAGEYGYDAGYFRTMLSTGAIDVLQADATRCAGITGFLEAGALCNAWGFPLSAHTAPSVHAHVCCAVPRVRHLEYLHDHVRIEHLLFDGALAPVDGALCPDLSRPGLGIELKRGDAAPFAV